MSMLDFAIQMELDGERYYREQAEKNQGNALGPVFKVLADAEAKHADLLQNRIADYAGAASESNAAEGRNVFAGLGDFKADAIKVPDQMDVYIVAMEMEQKSIDLYQRMLQEATESKNQQLLMRLIEEEQRHYAMFEELVGMLKQPKDWVESAEFGRRDEY